MTRSPLPVRLCATALVIGLTVVACSTAEETITTHTVVPKATETTSTPPSSSADTTTTTQPPGFVPTLSEWSAGSATLTVPLDHDDPSGPTISVPVTRSEATDPQNRIGVLLVNPGGPGYPATPLATFAEQVYTPELRARFDIVALDPRGTFPDTSVNCFSGLADLWSSVDYSPDEPGELEALDAAVQEWVDECANDHEELLEHVSTMDTVHDMAHLVEALGEDQVSYFGWSYGTTLGSAFLTEYPELVRATVLDGAYLAYEEPLAAMIDSYAAMEDLLVRIFSECDDDPLCPISGGAQAAFTRVAAQADAEPIVGNRLLPTVNEQGFAAIIRFSDAAYGGSADLLLQAVANADNGNYFRLQSMLGDVAALLEAGGSAMAISCMDYPYRGLVELPDDAMERLDGIAPTYSAVFPTPEGFDPFALPSDCARWPVGPDLLPQPLDGDGAGPVLVVTATGDPVTPIASARKLAEGLVDSTLVVVESNVHGSYQASTLGSDNARICATEHIDRFLIDLRIPEDGTVCAEE